jgi:hypothetical protein
MMLRASAAALLAASLALGACSELPGEPSPKGVMPAAARPASSRSVSGAYKFLRLMMDEYASGSTRRLVRSFDGGPLKNFRDAVTYDDALFVDAMVTQRSSGDIARAAVVGDAFLYVQAHDKAGDGRLRAAYAPKPLRDPSDVVVDDNTSDVGNMAWVGQALVQLYSATSDAAYLNGALRIARWLESNAYDTRGAGGYAGGYTARGQKIEWKSTEHNIDLYVLFTLLARETGAQGAQVWSARAAWARRFIASMWDGQQHHFYVGTASDGVTPNTAELPEDVNSWSFLALRDPAYAASVTWVVRNLSVTAGGFSGVSPCQADRSGVWFEGTAHLADALEFRGDPGDDALAARYLADIYHAQAHGPNGDGLGIIAASRDGLSDCAGGSYYASLHTGTTAWYILAAKKVDPFHPIR